MIVGIILTLLLLCGAAFGAFHFAKSRAERTNPADPVLTAAASGKQQQRIDERRLGYRYADDKLFVQGGGVFVGITMATATDEYATSDETADIVMRPVGLNHDLVRFFDGDNVQCQELVRYRTITSEAWLRQLLAHAWNPTPLYRTLAGKVAKHVKGATPQRMWILIVRLGDLPRRAAADPLAPLTTEILGVADERLTRKDLAPWRAKATQFQQIAARHGAEPLTRQDLLWLIRKVGHGHLPVPDEPVTRRRPWRGGFFELATVLRGDNLGGGVIAVHARNTETGEEETSYTATLVVQDQPLRQIFNPRNAWAKKLGKIGAEVNWRYTLVPGARWRKITDKAAGNVEDERKDREKAGANEDLAFEARLDQADQIKLNNAEDPDPGQVGRLRICVSSPTRKQLAQSIQDAKAAMGDIEIEVSEHGALLLLEEQLPGEPLPTHMGSLSAGPAGGLQLWESYTDTYQAAIAQIASHSQVGDRLQVVRGRLLGWIGMVIGYVKSNGTLIHFDPHAMMSRLAGAGIAVPGASGGGKTSFLLSMFFWLSESGARCRAIDPKIDFRNFVLYIAFGPQVLHPDFMNEADEGILGTPGSGFQPVNPQFWEDTEIFDLARGARGIRDPWRITKTFTEGYNLALDLIDALFFDDAHRRIVKKGLRALLNTRKATLARGEDFPVGFGDVVDHIGTEREELATDLAAAKNNNVDTSRIRESLDVVDEVCTRLENGEEQPFLRLLLGKGSDPQVAHAAEEKRRTIYTMSGYKTPDDPNDATNWSETDHNAAAVMHAVLYDLYSGLDGRLVPNPVTGEPGIRPSDTFVDEGNMFTASRSSRGFLRKVLRQGRSLYHALFFADQRARGIAKIEEEARADDPAEVNQFGVVAVFGQKSKNEARMGLELLRADGDNISTAERDVMARGLLQEGIGGRLSAGECAFRDPDSRVANAVIDQIFDVLQRASQTNADLKPADWAHPVPADPTDWTINPEALYRVRTGVAAGEEDADEDFFDDDDLFTGDVEDTDAPDLEENDYLPDEELTGATQ